MDTDVRYRTHNILPLALTGSQISPVHIVTPYFDNMRFIIMMFC